MEIHRQHFILIAILGALGGVLFGFDSGIIAGALIFVKGALHLSIITEELVVSCVVLGALIGAISSGKLTDYYGRRRILMLAAVTFIVGTVITVFTTSAALLIAGRFILGLAIGMVSYTVPLFIAEMAPTKHRGRLVLLNGIMITCGQAAAYLVAYWLATTASWRLMFAMGLIPAIMLLIGMLLVPETQRWTQRPYKLAQSHWRLLFSRRLRSVLIIGLGLGILQQAIGINTVMYYGPIIFKRAGFVNSQSSILATFAVGLINMLFSTIAVLIIDKAGRRRLLLFGTAIATISLAVVGFSFYHPTVESNWLALVAILAYIAGYAIGIGSLFWLIVAEIYPLAIRGFAMSFVTAVQWAANFLVSVTFLSVLTTLGTADTFWLYGLVGAIGLLFCMRMVPETNGISLEAIENNLVGEANSHLSQRGGHVMF